MTGLGALFPHIITIVLLWLAVIIIAQVVRYGIFRGMGKLPTDDKRVTDRKKVVSKAVRLINIGATVVALIFIILFILFMYDPTERSYEEMDKITPATPDVEFVEPTPEEIAASNREVIEKAHQEKKEEATQASLEAMDEASRLFSGQPAKAVTDTSDTSHVGN